MKKVVVILFFVGSFFTFANQYKELELFAHVLNIIQSQYFKPLKMKKLVHGAIQGLLRELDPHSQFFTSEKLKSFQDRGEGRFYGMGIELERKKGFLVVISVLPRSPAKKAGFKEGDRILAINEKAVRNFTLQEFFQIIQERKRMMYKITTLRNNRPIVIKVRPSHIKVQSVTFKKLENDFIYIRIFQFTKDTFFQVNKILESNSVKGLILDLRSNPGGIFEQAVQISDLFLSKGSIVSLKIKADKREQIFSAKISTTLPFFPIVVLINEYSASASEVVAGALKDNKRAVVMGRKSFGKGSIQNVFSLPRGYGLKLTIGEYYTPSGISIHGKGIKPHITLPPVKKEVSFSLKNLLEDSDVQSALKKLKSL